MLSALGLLVLACATLFSPKIQFWPPPNRKSWQSATFRSLFRVMFYGQLLSTLGHFWLNGFDISRLGLGAALALFFAGFLIAFVATGQLGWGNAFGAKEGLRTDGIFAYSRNPIYLATLLGLFGWGLLYPTGMSIMTLAFWGVLYVVAVFLEERWLGGVYGAAFDAYCKKVRRFI